MKKSILFVSGTLWAFSVFVGKSCPSAIYPLNSDDSNDGAILEKNSNKLDLPRDMSQPIIARFARDVTDEDPKVPIHLLIIIIPVVMGIVVIVIIVLVVCYMCRRSERGTCISNEWLIWCGLMKRSDPSSERQPVDYRSANASHAPVRRKVTDTTGQSRMPSTHDESAGLLTESNHPQTPHPVAEKGNHTGACPSERYPSLPDTPITGNSSLSTDDEIEFRFPNPDGAMHPTLENISENESLDDGRDNGRADRSGSDDDVFKECQRKSPSNASPGHTYRVRGHNVQVHINSVDNVHVGDRVTKVIFYPKDSTDTINNNSCAFNRSSLERKTH